MRIDTLSKTKIKITLTNSEIELLFGNYGLIDYNEPKSRLTIDMLIKEALPEDMLPLKCDKVLIEVKQIPDGCNILFTQIFDKKKQNSEKKVYTLEFDDSENMIKCILFLAEKKIKNGRSTLCRYNNKYRLMLSRGYYLKIPKEQLGEFCFNIYTSDREQELTRKIGTIICDNNAIETISTHFKVI